MLNIIKLMCVSLILLSVNGVVKSAELSTAATQLAKNIADLKTYQADFAQRVQNEKGKELEQSSGRFSIQRPNIFRWEIIEKYPQLIVADGAHLWTHDIELEQVTVQNQQKVIGNSPLLLLTSDAESLTDAFNISEVAIGKSSKQMFELKPKQTESVFERVHILFENGQLIELLLADSLGQQTSVKFSKIEVNKSLDKKLFTFVMPEGVDLVDAREKTFVE